MPSDSDGRCGWWLPRLRLVNLKAQSITHDILTDINARYGCVIADNINTLINKIDALQHHWLSRSQRKHIMELFSEIGSAFGKRRHDLDDDLPAPWLKSENPGF